MKKIIAAAATTIALIGGTASTARADSVPFPTLPNICELAPALCAPNPNPTPPPPVPPLPPQTKSVTYNYVTYDYDSKLAREARRMRPAGTTYIGSRKNDIANNVNLVSKRSKVKPKVWHHYIVKK